MGWLGLTVSAISLLAVPLSVLWLAVAVWLGKAHKARAQS
jgi:hypothetical protein